MADSAERNAAVTEAMQLWTSGNQAGAVDRLRPLADSEDRVALGLIVWFMHQMPPMAGEALDYAEKAIDQGNPWVINYVIGNAMNDANLRARIPRLFKKAIGVGSQLDPIGHAVGPLQQGDPATAIALLEASAGPYPYPEGVSRFLEEIGARREELEAATTQVGELRDTAVRSIEESEATVKATTGRVETRADQLETLMDQVTNAEAQSLFDSEAMKNETEGRTLWKRGVQILGAAAAVAILPILIFYIAHIFGKDAFEDQNLVAAHFAPALALGAVAGVVLARARGRDRAGQRARDLSVALGTMFAYSNQIRDEAERQQFLRDMGRTVIESFLHADAGSDADATNLLAALGSRT